MTTMFHCYCNECGYKKILENPSPFKFCPKCKHVNTGFTRVIDGKPEENKPKPTRKVSDIHLFRSPDKTQRELVELSRKLYYRFIEINKVISARPCYNWVKLGDPIHNRVDGRYKAFLDHGALFVCENNRKILASQPYALNESDIISITKWAGQRGLKVTVEESSSWYYPGRTTLLIFEVASRGVFDTYIEKNVKSSAIGFGMQEVE